MTRSLHPFLALLAIALGLAAPVGAQTITVRVGGSASWTIPDKNATDPRSRADRAVIEQFEKLHPNIRLVNANGLQIYGPAADSNLLLAFAGGTAPDVVYVNFRSMENYVQQGFLMPLDGYLAAQPDVIRRINPQIRNVITVDNHVYALPYAQFVQALYYRKDLFQQAGLDPGKPPANWDQFYDDCKAITDHDKGIWGFEWPGDAGGTAYWWINFLWQAGGEITTRNTKGQWVAAFDSPEGVVALNYYKHLVTDPYTKDGKTYDGVAAPSSPTYATDRAHGKVAMWFAYQSNIIANTADAASLNPSLIGIAPMPDGPGGKVANEINAAMWGISSQIHDSKVRDAAWQFIQYMGSDDADRVRTKAYVEAGLGSLISPVSLQKYGYGDEISASSRAWLQTNNTLFAHGHPEPYGANMQAVYNLLGQPLQAIALNPSADPKALLHDASAQVDASLIGYTAPRVMARRRAIAGTVFGVLMLAATIWVIRAFAGLLGRLRRTLSIKGGADTPRQPRGATKTLASGRRRAIMAWIFMAPAVLSIIVWAYYPLMRGLVMAFQDYEIILGARFVGLDNFIAVFTSDTVWRGLLNSGLFTVYSIGIGFFLPIILALLLSEVPRGTVLFRTLLYLPAVTTGLVTVYLWKYFEDPNPTGLFNTFLSAVHIPPQKWLTDPHWALLAVVLPGAWASAGPGSIIYLAALKSIPPDMYEAADLDGAGVFTKIFKITLPILKPLVLINLVGAIIGSFKATETVLIMTGGGPLYATHTIGLEIFYNAYLYLRFGYATAAAWLMGSLLVGFTLFQLRTMRNMRFSAAN